MKHKLSVLPVLFALLALVFVLTSCGSDGNVQSESVIKPRTITFYSITDEATTDEAIQRVQDELNKITESLYKVHVVLKSLEISYNHCFVLRIFFSFVCV